MALTSDIYVGANILPIRSYRTTFSRYYVSSFTISIMRLTSSIFAITCPGLWLITLLFMIKLFREEILASPCSRYNDSMRVITQMQVIRNMPWTRDDRAHWYMYTPLSLGVLSVVIGYNFFMSMIITNDYLFVMSLWFSIIRVDW